MRYIYPSNLKVMFLRAIYLIFPQNQVINIADKNVFSKNNPDVSKKDIYYLILPVS